jgi:uncharacterized peroxidase-related enzyme
MTYTTLGAEPAQNETLAAIEKKTGPNNFLRVMSRCPESMEAFLKLYGNLLGPGSIDRRIKEMVYLAVSTVNECTYCAAHHEKTAPKAGLTADEIHDIRFEVNRSFNQKEQAALQYARELTRTASVDDAVRVRAQEEFPGEQMVELTMVVAMANFTNRFNNGLAVPLEHQPVG